MDTEIQGEGGRAEDSVLRILKREGQEAKISLRSARWWRTGLTAEKLRGARPRASPSSPPILQDDGSGDATRCHEEGARPQSGNGASAAGAPGSRGPAVHLG